MNPDDPSISITKELDTSLGQMIIKSQYDAFMGTDLKKELGDRGVETVIITGVMTHLCCETTARSAFMHGYKVLFAADGTATDRLENHRATLLNLSHGFATPVLMGEMMNALEAKKEVG